MMKEKRKRRHRIRGKKKRCESCGHKHKRLKKGDAWFCMKKGCSCSGMVVGGKPI